MYVMTVYLDAVIDDEGVESPLQPITTHAMRKLADSIAFVMRNSSSSQDREWILSREPGILYSKTTFYG